MYVVDLGIAWLEFSFSNGGFTIVGLVQNSEFDELADSTSGIWMDIHDANFGVFLDQIQNTPG